MILCIETATPLCSAAICSKGTTVAVRESADGKPHSTLLTVFISELLEETRLKVSDLDGVAVSCGPGSYTGLRIGVSVAKGIAYGSSIPLIGIETTHSMFHGFRESFDSKYSFQKGDLFCPLLDARRMEVYNAVYTYDGELIRNICAEIIDENSFGEFPGNARIFFFGDGASKLDGIISRGKSIIEKEFRISATYMASPAYNALINKEFRDVAYFEPFYLKDFIATTPVKKIPGL